MTRVKNTAHQTKGKLHAQQLIEKAGAVNEGDKHGKKRRWRSGTIAVREMRKQMRGDTRSSISKAPFRRLVSELISDVAPGGLRIMSEALEILREESENFLRESFTSANIFTLNRGVTTLDALDFRLGSNWLNGNMHVEMHRENGIMAALPMHALARRKAKPIDDPRLTDKES